MNNQLIIENAKIIHPENISEEKTIYISDGHIRQITDDPSDLHHITNQVKLKKINAKQCYISPGLIDTHVHLLFNGSADIVDYVKHQSYEDYQQIAIQNITRSLNHGITTLRDMGDTSGIINTIRQQQNHQNHLPQLITAGEMITAPKGHVKTIAREITEDADIIKQALDDQIKHQADWIKIIVSGGLLTQNSSPFQSEMNQEMITTLCQESSKRNIPVAAHAYNKPDITLAIQAGVKSIEHGIFASSEIMAMAAEKQIIFTPTLKSAYDIIEHKDSLPSYMVHHAERIVDSASSFIKNALKTKLSLAMGTDAGTPFNYHGDNARELQYLIENGLPIRKAIESATSTAATLFNNHHFGLIKPGYLADCIILTSNPLDDITAFEKNIKYVISKGNCINST